MGVLDEMVHCSTFGEIALCEILGSILQNSISAENFFHPSNCHPQIWVKVPPKKKLILNSLRITGANFRFQCIVVIT
jgi:hypothetical protein